MTMTKSLTKLGFAALALGVVGCSFHARSPEKYREATRQLIESNRPAIEACYTNALQAKQDLTGRVSILFSVQPETGIITNTRIDEGQTNAPEQLATCVVEAVNGLTLAPPDEREGQATFFFDFVAQQPTAG
jgi:hypothetical protein